MTHIHVRVGNLTITGTDNGLSLVGAKPLSEQMVEYQLDPKEQTFKLNSYIFNQENAFECVVCEMAAI